MSLKKKLQRWQDQGLIELDVMDKILAFEKQRGSGRFLKALYGLGGFAIVIGILAVVAANWQIIPPDTKLFVHLGINTCVAAALYHFHKIGKSLQMNLSVLVLTGLTLTLIALTGQVFHLNGSIPSALITWMVLTTPFVAAFANSKISLIPWILALVYTIWAGSAEYLFPLFDDEGILVCLAALFTFIPLGFIHISSFRIMDKNPAMRDVLYYAGAASIIVGASLACLVWYAKPDNMIQGYWLQLVTIFIGGAFWARFIPLPKAIVADDDIANIRTLFFISLGVAFAPFILPVISDTVMAALSFIAYWLAVGYLAQKTNRQALMSIAITLVAIRIYIIYLELFGGLLQTGFGLIISGIVLIALASGARKLNKTLSTLSVEGGDDE